MVKFKLLGARVLVEEFPPEEVTKAGIIIPDTAKEKPKVGKVIAVGPGYYMDNGTLVPCTVKPGDIVYFSDFANAVIKDRETGKEYLIINERDILAIEENV